MDVLYSPKIQKQNSSLSELSKGVGEIAVTSHQEKRLEILLDESVKFIFYLENETFLETFSLSFMIDPGK